MDKDFYIIDLAYHPAGYELIELIKEFVSPEDFAVRGSSLEKGRAVSTSEKTDSNGRPEILIELPGKDMTKDEAKRFLFDELRRHTGYAPAWGTLTGVRPTKLANELMLRQGLSLEETGDIFRNKYYVNEEKTGLILETCRNQSFITGTDAGRSAGVYIGIPFCPTRCLYCSFTSNQSDEKAMREYLDALLKEVAYAGRRMKELGVTTESIYFGGGTPTSLWADALDELLSCVDDNFDLTGIREYCVEAGRPDTITEDKLSVLKRHGVDRVSINPQSMNQKTLDIIGRSHTVEDIKDAFGLVKASGIPHVNTDLIAGLPGEDYGMFMHTLEEVIALEPSNITVHTLAVKRASRLKEADKDYHYSRGEDVGRMVADARKVLGGRGYWPYYMYRQKHMAGNFENVGYALEGTESVYNIRIMDEHQTIVALGAGGISKAYFGPENKLERVPNVSNYRIYIERIDEMTERKEKKLWDPFL